MISVQLHLAYKYLGADTVFLKLPCGPTILNTVAKMESTIPSNHILYLWL